MLSRTADAYEVSAIGDGIEHAALFVELLAHLIEIGDFDIGAEPDDPRVRRELAEQQAQQSGLSGAVRTDDANAIAAHDDGREVTDDGALAAGETHILRLDYQSPRPFRFLRLQLHGANALASLSARCAQRLEIAHAPFVAGASRLYSGADPHLFLCQLAIELRPLSRFDVERRFLAREICIVVAAPVHQFPAIEFHDACRHAAQKCAIVGHEHQRRAAINEVVLHPLDSIDVEVVGRFVKQQNIRLTHQRSRKQCLSLASARRIRERQLRVKRQMLKDGGHTRLDLPRVGAVKCHMQSLEFAQRARARVMRDL